jgi:hypothetical protein
MRYAVMLVVNDGEGNLNVSHVATCLTRSDADHFVATAGGDDATMGVIEVGDAEWVHPMFAELAQPEGG